MGKKKFIDKKKSVTFQLLARDSSDPNYSEAPGNDRVFVRVDNNPVSIDSFTGSDDPYSIFSDAPEDTDNHEDDDRAFGHSMLPPDFIGRDNDRAHPLPEHVRKEILELGFPDDGYNYLIHVREIKNTGGGSAFYENPKFRADNLPRDVKAYDASRLQISKVNEEPPERSMYSVASKIASVRIQKVVDPEVAALLDDSDLSRFGSDVEELEEDFLVQANLLEEEQADQCNGMNLAQESLTNRNNAQDTYAHSVAADDIGSLDRVTNGVTVVDCIDEKPRVHRLLDEQFDLLERQEYGTDDDHHPYDDYLAEEDESLAEKLKLTLNDHVMDNLQLENDKYKVPADLLKDKEAPKIEEQEDSVDVIRRCKEYAERYEIEDEDKEVVVVQESSDESEAWDCETIVSTYSNLDNHPGLIEAPEVRRKKKLAETVSTALRSSSHLISLRGKEKLPVDFLPSSRKSAAELEKRVGTMRTEQYSRKQQGKESKEEKKERKAAVKEERREARRLKKEMKGLYRGEAHLAQRVAAVSGPSSIHIL
ncbi:hypothetical protein L6164_023408 [Bauhinia variegata]|uniref:Uncharacterized protein n=1 Tax=Bauhinia variegata TaxID=167791 RepID=A0ACB9MI47_BAUVA|nr:hypothetical protein L6164_023408 [Bauhinia variegata]